jgi:hypothetical protein
VQSIVIPLNFVALWSDGLKAKGYAETWVWYECMSKDYFDGIKSWDPYILPQHRQYWVTVYHRP